VGKDEEGQSGRERESEKGQTGLNAHGCEIADRIYRKQRKWDTGNGEWKRRLNRGCIFAIFQIPGFFIYSFFDFLADRHSLLHSHGPLFPRYTKSILVIVSSYAGGYRKPTPSHSPTSPALCLNRAFVKIKIKIRVGKRV
jgi:hypothetical protein